MNYTTLLVTDEPPIRRITLNRPERRNAMTPEMQNELLAAMEEAATADCRALVLTGAGKAFCSGLDLTVLQELQGKSATEHHADAERVGRLLLTLYELPIPTIAAVHGAAIGGGAGLATICDFTLATPDAKFGYTETRIGFVPALVSAFLALQLGDKRCRDLFLTSRIFDAEEAYRIGLVNQIVEPENLESAVQMLVGSLAANSPQALAATKRLLAAQNRPWLDAAIVAAMEANAKSRDTADFSEGVAAFLEKRKPNWTK